MTPEREQNGNGWDGVELDRAARLAREVRAVAGADARLVAVRAPGRVNLIGEHTDYSSLPVLPVAIERSTIVVAARLASAEILLRNLDRAYPPRSFRIERSISPSPPGDWANYVKAAVQGVIDHFTGCGKAPGSFRGGVLAIEGSVPAAAGLSSSAALTVSSALAFLAMNDLDQAPIETAAMVARSEWYVGTMAGGMDQAASLMGQCDHAMLIEFNPLRVSQVRMPADAALVVADSREVADKSGKVRGEYNRRVIECSLAARLLGRALRIANARVLGDVVRAAGDRSASDLIATLRSAAPERLGADLADAARLLGVARAQLARDLAGPGAAALDPARPLEVLMRARHVLGETERVYRAADALRAGRLEEMGALMNASHESLRTDFQCSTARLDRMVEIARRGGALGARLTGAGFGGSIVALCRADSAARVIAALDRGYYAALGIDPDGARAVLHASAGASAIELAAA